MRSITCSSYERDYKAEASYWICWVSPLRLVCLPVRTECPRFSLSRLHALAERKRCREPSPGCLSAEWTVGGGRGCIFAYWTGVPLNLFLLKAARSSAQRSRTYADRKSTRLNSSHLG